MKDLLIVIASQDYDYANHRGLWEELSKHTDVLVANIPADYITSTLTRKTYRIREARSGIKTISDNLQVFRPILPLRLEIAPDNIYSWIIRSFWKQVESFYSDLSSRKINILVYDGRWIKALKGTKEDLKFGYYLFDEVRENGKDGSQDAIRTKYDDYACTHANFILTMTELLAQSRSNYQTPKIVIGNGATIPKDINSYLHIPRSVAFIGNIRDWIDTDLLSHLIQLKQDCFFAFVGPIEQNMEAYIEELLCTFMNVAYFGKAQKERMSEIYRMFDAVIIPYKKNSFIKATRPIKIVESVLAGTPVVTVPVDGYEENAFIRFAKDANSFSTQLDYVMKHKVIEENLDIYRAFVEENTWCRKAEIIISLFHESRKI